MSYYKPWHAHCCHVYSLCHVRWPEYHSSFFMFNGPCIA